MTCSKTDCAVHLALGCELGHPDHIVCPNFNNQDPAPNNAPTGSGRPLPWTGRALGLNDISLATSRTPALLVGIVGTHGTGKTSLIASMFSHLAVSGTVSEHKFAGSYSLGGWESLRQPATWPAQSGPTFPAHTADNGQRAPSLLHLSLRRGEETSKDLLFTDAPGEWYSRWVGKRSASDAKGARWIVEHSHRFILVADCAALGGPDVGIAREKLLSLARPLSEARSSREILVVWTKSDAQRSKETESVVAERLKGLFGPHDSLETNVHSVDCLAVLGWCLRPLVAQSLGPPDRKTSSAFWAYARGRE